MGVAAVIYPTCIHLLRVPQGLHLDVLRQSHGPFIINLHTGSKKYMHIQDLGSFLTAENFPLLYIMEK